MTSKRVTLKKSIQELRESLPNNDFLVRDGDRKFGRIPFFRLVGIEKGFVISCETKKNLAPRGGIEPPTK